MIIHKDVAYIAGGGGGSKGLDSAVGLASMSVHEYIKMWLAPRV